MTSSKMMATIVSIVFILLFIIIIWVKLFSVWIFFGMLFLGALYILGYFYVINFLNNKKERDREEVANRKKLDWCWSRVNEILKKMPGGQGIEWRQGIGRHSEVKTFYDGIQHRPFRSMAGYLSETQQLIIVIYDIDNDDIVRFHANPTPDVIQNHFSEFKPYQTSSGVSGFSDRYSNRGRRRLTGRPRGVSIHVGDDDRYDDFDSMSPKYKPDDSMVDDAAKKLMENKGGG